MNSQEQESRSFGTTIPEQQTHQIVVLLARMMRQNLTATTLNMEGTAKTRREPDERLRTTSRS